MPSAKKYTTGYFNALVSQVKKIAFFACISSNQFANAHLQKVIYTTRVHRLDKFPKLAQKLPYW